MNSENSLENIHPPEALDELKEDMSEAMKVATDCWWQPERCWSKFENGEETG